MKADKGFTLIELMITVAIIGILATIALALYENYTVKSADNACLLEVKGYVNSAMVALHEANPSMPQVPDSACQSIDAVVNFSTEVTAVPKPPGKSKIVCDMSSSGSCALTPGS